MGGFDKQKTRGPWLTVLGVIVFFCAVYSSLWLAFAINSRDKAIMWIEEQKKQGLNVRYDKLLVTGYPFTICFKIINPGLGVAKTSTSWDWQGTVLEVIVQLWDRSKYRLKISGQQTLTFGKTERIQKFSGDIKLVHGQLAFSEGEIKKVDITLQGLQLANKDNANAMISIPWAQLSLFRLEKIMGELKSSSWSLSGSTTGFSLPWFHSSPLGQRLKLSLKAHLTGTIKNGPLDRSLEDWRDRGGTIEVDNLKMQHGPLKIDTKGTLALDGKLQPVGELTAHLEGFFETIDALKRLGVVGARNAITAKMVLGVLSRTPEGGGPATLNLALILHNRYLYLGPVRLLKLPKIKWL